MLRSPPYLGPLVRAGGWALVLAIATSAATPCGAQRVTLVWDGDSNDDYNEETGEGFRGVSPDVSTRRDVLERLGFNTRVDNPNNSSSWWSTYGATTLYDLVYVTGEADTDALADKLRGHQTPILSEHPEFDDNLGFAASAGTTSSVTQLSIDTTAHPITATSSLGPLSVYTASNEIGRLAGTPAVSLVALASEGGQTALGAIDVGGALVNTISSNATAVTRLVRLPFAGDSDWREINEAPVAELLEQAVLWATASTYTPTGSQGVCVMLTEQNGVLHEQEFWRVRRLAYMGWAVVYLWDGDSQSNYDTAIAAADVVYVPATADPSDVGDKLRSAACGVVYESNELDDNLGLATGGGIVSSNPGVIIADRGHPITGNFYDGDYRECFEYFRYTNNDWPGISQPLGRMTGTLAPDLDVLATRWSDPVLAAIDAGGELANNIGGNDAAAGRRVRLPWVSDSLDIRYLRSWNAGSQLWELALDWASGPNAGSLVAHYKLDETSGATATDSSANGNDGEYRGGVTQNITPAPRTRAANFDAVGEHVYASPSTELQNLGAGNADYSIAMWFRPGAVTHGEWRNLLHIGGADSNDRGPLIMVHPTNRRAHIWISTTTISSGTGGYCGLELDQDEWAHLAVVKQGAYVRWYVNGEFTNSFRLNGESDATAGHLRIGEEAWWGRPDGDLDDVRVYDYALNDQEITALHETLVLHLTFDETAGNTAADSSVFENDGTYTGSPTLGADGTIGEAAVEFDGSTSYLRVPAAEHLDMTETLTIAAWVNVDEFDNADGIFSRGDDGEQPYALRLRADRKLQWRSNHSMNTPGTSPTSQTFLSTGQLAAGQWAHVAATWDGSNVRFYIDGVLDSTHTLTGTVGVTTEDSAIGSDIVDADEWFDGRIDDLRVYNRALSDTEVFELGGSGLRLHLKLDETSGTVADDSGPFIFDGDLIDGPEPGVEGVVDRAIRMNDNDANQERIEIPSTAVDGLTAMTVTWWMKTEKTGETAILTGATTSGSNPANSVLVYFRSHTEFSPWVDQSEAGRSTLSESLADGRWHHWAYTCDRAVGRYRLYRDAEEVATRTFTPRSGGFEVAPGGLFVAHDQDTLGGSFSPEQALVGDLDDFRIYGRVLDAEEIAELYGLIGHWRLDEIDGDTVAVDDTAFAHNGDYVRTPTLEEESPYPSETVRTAARMEPGDYLRIPNKDHLEVGKDDADFSIAYWLKNNREASGQWRETIKKHFDGRRRTFAMWLRPDDNRMHCRISTKHAWNEGTDTVSGFDPGVWRHMAYVKRGSELRLYVDGLFERADTLQGEVVSNNGDIYAGVRSTGWRNDVTLDDFRIYSRALNDWEVAELHGLVGWYRMEDLAGSVVTDSSGTANHGAVVGSTPSWPTDAREGLASIELDGTNYIDASNDWARGEGGGAVAAWGKLVQRDSGGSELVSLSNRLAIRLDLAWSGPQAALAFAYNGSGWQPINSGRSFEGGRWSHFAASYREDIRELSFYIDGVLVDTATLTGSPDFSAASLPIRIGQHAGSETVRNFTGLIDDVRVYNRPISRAEARGLYYGSQTPGLRIVRWSEVANP